MRFWLLIGWATFAFMPGAAAAPQLDCAGPIAQAQKAIDKVTGDLQGMDKMMAKSEMSQIHRLVGQATRLNTQARKGCQPTEAAFAQAEAVAHATAAGGYATAADALHFHYMQAMSSGTKQGSGAGGMPATGGAPRK